MQGCNARTHLWVPFNPSSFLANTCLVRLGIDHFQQVQGIVDTSGGEALDLLGFAAGLCYACGIETFSSVKCAGTCGFGTLLLISTLVGCLLGWDVGFLLREETGGFCLTGELFQTLGLLIGTLVLFRTLLPLGCLQMFLCIPRSLY